RERRGGGARGCAGGWSPGRQPSTGGGWRGAIYRLSRRRLISVAASRGVDLLLNGLPPGTDALPVAVEVGRTASECRVCRANAPIALTWALAGCVAGRKVSRTDQRAKL